MLKGVKHVHAYRFEKLLISGLRVEKNGDHLSSYIGYYKASGGSRGGGGGGLGGSLEPYSRPQFLNIL